MTAVSLELHSRSVRAGHSQKAQKAVCAAHLAHTTNNFQNLQNLVISFYFYCRELFESDQFMATDLKKEASHNLASNRPFII